MFELKKINNAVIASWFSTEQAITTKIFTPASLPPAVRLPTVGRRAFSVAGARVWNALPADVTSAPSL